MRLAMFGTGPFAAPTFLALFETSHTMVGLVTQPPRSAGQSGRGYEPAGDEAARHGTPIFDSEDVNTAESRAALAAWNADLFVVADYGQILSAETLSLAGAGRDQLAWVAIAEVSGAARSIGPFIAAKLETGVSTIHMTPKVDAGPVLAQSANAD